MHIDGPAWVLIVAAVIAAGVIVGTRLAQTSRWVTRTVAPQQPPLKKGDRPEVVLDVDGIRYDVTETGRMRETAKGLIVWTFTGPPCMLTAEETLILVPVFPPGTAIEVEVG